MSAILSFNDLPAKLGKENGIGEIGVCFNQDGQVQVAIVSGGLAVGVSLHETEWTMLVDFLEREAAAKINKEKKA